MEIPPELDPAPCWYAKLSPGPDIRWTVGVTTQTETQELTLDLSNTQDLKLKALAKTQNFAVQLIDLYRTQGEAAVLNLVDAKENL